MASFLWLCEFVSLFVRIRFVYNIHEEATYHNVQEALV